MDNQSYRGIMKLVKVMTIQVDNLKIHYIQYGEGTDIVLLHGWGQNIEMMQPIANALPGYRYTILDFPGFGESEEPKEEWNMMDYTKFLETFLQKVDVKKPILIGHSFGGRVAICYGARNDVSKIVLFGAPCVRMKRKSLKETVLKSIKKLPGMNQIGEFAKKYIGSTDYRNATPIMRKTLVNVINLDLSGEAKKIKAPTLLIWGSLDTEAPIEDAKKLEALLQDGALITLEGCTHYAYLEALPQVVNILKSFI